MDARTVITGVLLTAVVVGMAYFLGISNTMFLIAAYNALMAVVLIMGREKYDRLTSIINPYRYKIYKAKDDKFKERIKPDPIGNFIVAALFIYIGYRNLRVNIVLGLTQYIAIALFLIMYYFLEPLMLERSRDWMEYRRFAAYLAIGALGAAFLLM